MSITDELREYTEKQIKWLDMTKVHYHKLFSIADRIDEKADEEATKKYLTGFDEGFASADDWLSMNEGDLAKHGWVKLPVDADGVPIRMGDVIAYKDNTKPKEVVALVPPSVVMVEDGPRHADMCRHYHKPTVEDVLREFVAEFNRDDSELCDEEIIERFAAKLRLEGDAE